MVIDAHIHAFGSRAWWPEWTWQVLNQVQGARFGMTPEEMDRYRNSSFDSTGEVVVGNMDRAGVDQAVVCVADLGMCLPDGDTPVSIERINEETFALVKKHPGRLHLAVGVDPRRKNALEILERGVREQRARYLKLYPPAGWYPTDPKAYSLYERCVDYGLPVNFHTGPAFGPLKAKYSHPVHLDQVAADFPELVIYCTHCGYGQYMELVSIARTRSNMICDLAGWAGWFHCGEAKRFYETWRFITNVLGGKRVLFASDHTGLCFLPGVRDEYTEWVEALKRIPQEIRASGIDFSEEEATAFFRDNAQEWLKIGVGS